MKNKFKKTEILPKSSTIEEFEVATHIYKFNVYDRGSYSCEKVAIKLTDSYRPVKDSEVSLAIIDEDTQECSCESFTRRWKQRPCKHLRYINFARQNNLLTELLTMNPDGYKL